MLRRSRGSLQSLDEFNAAVHNAKGAMATRMVGPYRDSAELTGDIHTWVQQARAVVANRLGMEKATVEAEYVVATAGPTLHLRVKL